MSLSTFTLCSKGDIIISGEPRAVSANTAWVVPACVSRKSSWGLRTHPPVRGLLLWHLTRNQNYITPLVMILDMASTRSKVAQGLGET